MTPAQFAHSVATLTYVTLGLGLAVGAPAVGLTSPSAGLGLGCLLIASAAAAHSLLRGFRRDSDLHDQVDRLALGLNDLADRLERPPTQDAEANTAGALSLLAEQVADLRAKVEGLQALMLNRAEPMIWTDLADGPEAPAGGASVDTVPLTEAAADGDATVRLASTVHFRRLLKQALRDNRVDLYLQPVVRLPSRRVVSYEGLARLRDADGAIIKPFDFMPAARATPLATALDSLLLLRIFALLRRVGPRRRDFRLFCNLSAEGLQDEGFVAELTGFLDANPGFASQMMFELSADDVERLPSQARAALGRLARRTSGLSIDQLLSLDIDIDAMNDLNLRFVKAPAPMLISEPGQARLAAFRAALSRRNVTLIATHIEDERSIVEVLDLGVDFGQGFLFGAPRPARLDDNGADQAA